MAVTIVGGARLQAQTAPQQRQPTRQTGVVGHVEPQHPPGQSGVLLLMRYTPKKAPADPAEDVERLLELAPNMRSSDYSAARAPIPSLPHLLASGVWNTFKLLLIVGAGLIALLALFYLIARLA